MTTEINSLLRTEAFILARQKAEECIQFLREEAKLDSGRFAGHATDAQRRFWELIADEAMEHLPVKPARKPQDATANNQRYYTGEIVETVHGGRMVSDCGGAMLVEIGGEEHMIPKSLMTEEQRRLLCNERFDCLHLPEWLCANRGIDWDTLEDDE